jgi:hypothetical protein
MAVIVVAKPSAEATTSGTPLVANTADDAPVQEIVVRVGLHGSLRLTVDEAEAVQRDLMFAVSRVRLLATFEALPFEWKQCTECRHLRKTLDGICGNCADDLRAERQAAEADPG